MKRTSVERISLEAKPMWIRFWDMRSGGNLKTDFHIIFIEANTYEDAINIFENRFNIDPFNIACDCCDEDFSIDKYDTLELATAYHRGCKFEKEKGWVMLGFKKYFTLAEFMALPEYCFIFSNQVNTQEII